MEEQRTVKRLHIALALVGLSVALSPLAARAACDNCGRPALDRVALDFYRDQWRFSPEAATRTGVHDYDTKIQAVDPQAFAAEVARLRRFEQRVEAIDEPSLDLDGQTDRQLLLSDIKLQLYTLDTRETWRTSPDYYVNAGSQAVFSIMARDFAPAATRLSDVVAREEQIPAMVRQGEQNLRPDRIPAISAQLGAVDAKGAADFLTHDVTAAFDGVGDAALRARFAAATKAAAAAYTQYAGFISSSVVPHAHAPFAIGAADYAYLESLQNAEDIPLSKLLAVGEANLAKDKAAFIATARQIDPGATPEQVAAKMSDDHPTADQLLPTAQTDLDDLVAFIKAKHIIDLPDAPVAKVVPTPEFARQFTFASMDAPGPLEKVATEAYYNVTPVDSSMTPAQAEQHLRFFNRYQTMVISSHECYPGHYVNFLFNKRANISLIRQLEWNVAFGEGWAHYDEQMMVDEGLGNGDPRYRLAQLTGALLRDGRYIVGIKEHTQGMTIDQATQFLMDNAFVGREPAYREAVRGTQDPLYGYYTLGKLMLLKLRADYQAKMGPQYSLAAFHDALLSHGDPPIYYARKLLLGADDKGSLL